MSNYLISMFEAHYPSSNVPLREVGFCQKRLYIS